ncbi:MAG: hypothetical protein ACFUZC_00700 [Chthoniobacteraceae bacterium]
MDSPNAVRVLQPSFSRAFVRILAEIMLACAVGAVWERYRLGYWWSVDYMASLLILLLVFPVIVCVMFVPRRFDWCETELKIQLFLRREKVVPWNRLYAYGTGNNVFLLQFEGLSTFQIYAGAFKSAEWKEFRAYLTATYPRKKARFWLGPKAIRKG